MIDEARLLELSRQGRLEAFNALVETHQQMVFNVAVRTLGDWSAAADVTQETFIRAHRSLDRFRGGSFRGWLLRIATNLCYDRLRAQKRRPADSLDELLTHLGDPGLPDINPSPETVVLSREQAHNIQRALAALPAEQRLAIILSDVQGLTYEETATATQTNVGTVKSRISRGRARLRTLLNRQGELLGELSEQGDRFNSES